MHLPTFISKHAVDNPRAQVLHEFKSSWMAGAMIGCESMCIYISVCESYWWVYLSCYASNAPNSQVLVSDVADPSVLSSPHYG
jgi:hypothetical protein